MRRPGSTTKAVTVNARYRIWRSMRILRRFTAPDLCATAEAGRWNVQQYMLALARAGYLRIAVPRKCGVRAGHAIYALARDTGPNPPRIHRDGTVYDPNPGEKR